jgi:hypothetical protein
MYEHHRQPLASRKTFTRRLLNNAVLVLGILLVSLGVGMCGYHFLEGLSWIDSLLNASMILGGHGTRQHTANYGWKNLCIRLCLVFRGHIAGIGWPIGGSDPPSLPAPFSFAG